MAVTGRRSITVLDRRLEKRATCDGPLSFEMSLRDRAKDVVRRAREDETHVVRCTPATLSVAVLAALYAWIEFEYHLCVRRGRDHSECHDLRSRTVEV